MSNATKFCVTDENDNSFKYTTRYEDVLRITVCRHTVNITIEPAYDDPTVSVDIPFSALPELIVRLSNLKVT
jgi:hypothetical protein